MITPLDIEKKEFSKGVRGYNIEEVDEFLDNVIVDLEMLLKENLQLHTQIEALEQENEKLKGAEGSVVQVLEQAKGLMGDISASAERRAEVIMKNAELDAELVVREARQRAERLKEENAALKKSFIAFRDRYRAYLEDELQRVESTEKDLLGAPDDSLLDELLSEPVDKSAILADDGLDRTRFAGGAEPRKAQAAPKFDTASVDLDERKTVIMDPSELQK